MDKDKIMHGVREILEGIGEDPSREGLADTPLRVANMCEELFSGLTEDPTQHLVLFHEQQAGQVIVVRDIPLYSVCEHHLLPFFGTVDIAYIPSDQQVIGLSKLARIVNSFARRPQLQERIGSQVADFIDASMKPHALMVAISAEHLCMTMRGVRAPGAVTRTCTWRGAAVDDAALQTRIRSVVYD